MPLDLRLESFGLPCSPALLSVLQESFATLKPPRRRTLSEWADEERWLSPEASDAGQWHTDRFEYQREIMDALTDPEVDQVDVQASSQVGKTEIGLNFVGYFIDHAPSPILVVMPSVEKAEEWSQERLAPMLRDSPCFRGKVRDPRSRDSGNRILHKLFPGGHISVVGANAPAGLASRPIRVLLFDEVGRFPRSAGTEGSPLALAIKRTTAFRKRRKILCVSTPGIRGECMVEARMQETDKRRFFVPCHACGQMQTMRWRDQENEDVRGGRRVRWEPGKPETARYHCEACDVAWSDAQRMQAVRLGHWRATAEGKPGRRGYYLNELYSPLVILSDMVAGFLEAKKLPETLQVWVNTSLGETWEDRGEKLADQQLQARAEAYEAEPLPEKVAVITAGVDVQDDRLEVELVGWGRDQECWSIDYQRLDGDPTSPAVWQDLDVLLSKTYRHPCGTKLRIAVTCIDSGHHTQAVYKFTGPRHGRRIFAIKGRGGYGLPALGRPGRNNVLQVPVYSIGVDTIKAQLMKRLKIREPGPGYCHFPTRYDESYYTMLLSERMVMEKGKPVWKKDGRNEPLDCRVYAMAGLEMLAPRLNAWADQIAQRMRAKVEQEAAPGVTLSGTLPPPASRRPGRRVRSQGIGARR